MSTPYDELYTRKNKDECVWNLTDGTVIHLGRHSVIFVEVAPNMPPDAVIQMLEDVRAILAPIEVELGFQIPVIPNIGGMFSMVSVSL